VTESGFVSFTGVTDLDHMYKRVVKKVEKKMKKVKVLLEDEYIFGIFEEKGIVDNLLQVLQMLQTSEMEGSVNDVVVEVHI